MWAQPSRGKKEKKKIIGVKVLIIYHQKELMFPLLFLNKPEQGQEVAWIYLKNPVTRNMRTRGQLTACGNWRAVFQSINTNTVVGNHGIFIVLRFLIWFWLSLYFWQNTLHKTPAPTPHSVLMNTWAELRQAQAEPLGQGSGQQQAWHPMCPPLTRVKLLH